MWRRFSWSVILFINSTYTLYIGELLNFKKDDFIRLTAE